MKKRLRFFAGLAALCVALSAALTPLAASAAGAVFFVPARASLYRDAFPVRLYERGGQLYMDAVTLAGISGYAREGDRMLSLGYRTVSPAGGVLIGGTRCFPMEKTLDRLGVRVWEKDGELFFLSGRDALLPLFEAMGETGRFRSLLDPDDLANTLGAALSYAKDILLTWNFKGVLERYRNAMYSLIREDLDQTTFSTLAGQWEDGINKPVSTVYSFLESVMDEEELDAFFAGSELMNLKGYVEGIGLEEKVLGMKLSDYLRRLEEIALYFDTSALALRAVEYAAEEEPVTAAGKEIVKAAKEIRRSAALQTEGWDERLIGQLAREHLTALFYAASSGLLKEMMLGKKNPVPKILGAMLDRIPAIRFMSDLEEAYTFAEIQQFFESGMLSAEVEGSWVKYKYMTIMYDRCFYASCEALRGAGMEDVMPDWQEQLTAFQEGCMAQAASLAAVPDSALEPFLLCSEPVSPGRLRRVSGPEPDYSLLPPRQAEETADEAAWPDAVLQGAKQAWETACAHYGRVSAAVYGGETYLDEGDGAALPVLSKAGGAYYLNVLLQRGETLAQMVFGIGEDGSFRQVYYDATLTLGGREALFLYARSGSALLSAAVLDGDAAAFATAGEGVEKRFFRGNENAGSIADIGAASWDGVRALYGDPEWTVRADADGGLFRLEIRDAQGIRDRFGVEVP